MVNNTVSSIRNHIPDGILVDNQNLDKLIKIFEALMKVKKDEVFDYSRSFLFPLLHDIRMMRRSVDEWGAEYILASSSICLDCLYRKYFEIYSSKGTFLGLTTLLACLNSNYGLATVTIESYMMGKPLILFDDERGFDCLPSSDDILGEITADSGSERWCPTLLDDSFSHARATINILIVSPDVPKPYFIDFMKSIVYLYTPMVNRNFLNVLITHQTS